MNVTRALSTSALLLAVPLSRLVGGCSTDECTEAADRYLECQPEQDDEVTTSTATGTGTTGGGEGRPPSCEDVYLCESRCVLKASCDALTFKDQAASQVYLTCVDDCRKKASTTTD